MVGEDTNAIPAWLAKNSREHPLPLGSMAKAILTPRVGRDVCIFPALGKETPFNGYSRCKPKLENWTLHGLRRTFASGLAAQGVQLPVIERLLNHVSGSFGGIVSIYQRYDYLPEMRDAIEKWERHILSLTHTNAH